jgi:DNA-binding NtrC family response regulator
MPSVLIVDDLISIHEMLEAVIQPNGFSTVFATDGEKGLARYKAEKFDIILADIDMKPMDGITLLKHVKLYDPNCVVIIMTAYASTELIATLKRAIEFKEFQAQRMTVGVAPGVKADEISNRLIGTSASLKKLVQQVKKLATVRSPVLLMGENGTGKTAVAEILHAANTGEAPLVRIDCALSTETNLRAGLIGENGEGGTWVKQAKGGTLYLQHLQCLSRPVQKELVSVLRNTAHGFRLICTTAEDLERLTDEGKFDDELFYRVASLPAHLPPLRDRKDDIPSLVKHYTAKATNPHFESSLIEFTEDALATLAAYHWPGNLTELLQVVSKIAATTETRVVTSQQLPMRLREIKDWPKLADYLAGQQRQYIDMVLRACRGDTGLAAKVLGTDVQPP